MPPKKAASKAAAPKAAAPKKSAAAAKKTAPAKASTAKASTAKATKAATNDAVAAKKRKADEHETEPESDIENEAPKTKKAKTSVAANVPKPKAPAKEAAKPTTKKPAAKAAPKKAATPAPEAKPSPKTKKAAATAAKKRKAEEVSEVESEVEEEPAKKVKLETPSPMFPNLQAHPSTLSSEAAESARKLGRQLAKRRVRVRVRKPRVAKSSSSKAPEEAAEQEKEDEAGSRTSQSTNADELKPATKAKAKAPVKEKAAVEKKKPAVAIGKKINEAPTQKLDIYVFGEGSSGELGLGSRKVNGKKPIDVKRPRLNDNLSTSAVGVVQIACGGMHAVALTHDNKILTWGVNDQGALGRDTNWEGNLKDADASDSEDDEDTDDTGMNPRESTPTEVPAEHFAAGARFAQIIASDSASFALTEDGRVYGWGTFRGSEGILGFSDKVKVQQTPVMIPGLKNVTAIAAGSNHVLALDTKGNVVAWGCGQQSQLGRRIIERNRMASLVPQGLGLPRNSKITKIACGPYHSFALDKDGQVWAWGLNNFAETGIEDGAGKDDAVVFRPTIVDNLRSYKITDIAGGVHHSIACSEDGELLAWGRIDSHQVGIPLDQLNEENAIYDEQGKPRILVKPTVIPEVADTVMVAAGTDNNFAVTSDGKVYSWGFSGNYQTGLGTIDDVETPTRIENSAIRDKKIIFAGCGGQFSILAGLPDGAGDAKVNGTK